MFKKLSYYPKVDHKVVFLYHITNYITYYCYCYTYYYYYYPYPPPLTQCLLSFN